MNKVEFYINPDGSIQVRDFVTETLRTMAKKNNGLKKLYMKTLAGLNYLQTCVLSEILNQDVNVDLNDDEDFQVTLVKNLNGFQPLLEFRVNERGYGAVRIVFFKYVHHGETYFVMMRGIVKQQTTDPAFIAIRGESFGLIPEFLKDPGKFINLP